MTHNDQLELLRKAVSDTSQSEVAKKTGYGVTAINQVLHGKYGGSAETVLKRIEEIYSQEKTVFCPVLGDITPGYCVEQRNLHFSPDQISVLLRKHCPACPHNPKRGGKS